MEWDARYTHRSILKISYRFQRQCICVRGDRIRLIGQAYDAALLLERRRQPSEGFDVRFPEFHSCFALDHPDPSVVKHHQIHLVPVGIAVIVEWRPEAGVGMCLDNLVDYERLSHRAFEIARSQYLMVGYLGKEACQACVPEIYLRAFRYPFSHGSVPVRFATCR